MIYFNCTSVFHTFLISYMMLKEFSASPEAAYLLIPGHVSNLVALVPNIRQLPFVADVYVVEESCMNLEEYSVLKAISFQHTDTVLVGGMERLGMWLIQKGKAHGCRVIIFEEGANIIHNPDKHMRFIYTLGGVKKGELLAEDIHEIWKLNGVSDMSVTDRNILVHDLEMRKYLHDAQFLNRLLTCMDLLFLQEVRCKLAPIVFFDSYVLAACKNCSRSMEKHILQKLVATLSDWNYEIKPHPNDYTEWKYEKDYTVSSCSNVPIELLRLRQSADDTQEEIYIAYGITGCITNELFLLGGSRYVIFLYKILRMYGIEYPGESLLQQLYEACTQMQKKKIFFPETFTELKIILNQITGKEVLSKEEISHLEEAERSSAYRLVRNRYKDLYKNLVDELNETSLLYKNKKQNTEWEVLANNKILANRQRYTISFTFEQRVQTNDMDVRWYIAKGIIVKVKLHRISCFDENHHLVAQIASHDLKWLEAQREEHGWYTFDNCDAMAEFSIRQKQGRKICSIVIEAEIEWNFSYEAMRLLRNKNLEKMAGTVESLVKQTEENERTIRKLAGYLNDWEKEVQNRDDEIKNTIRQRDELNAVLVREREQWQTELTAKEQRMRELETVLEDERKRWQTELAAKEQRMKELDALLENERKRWQTDMLEKERRIEKLESNWCIRIQKFFR